MKNNNNKNIEDILKEYRELKEENKKLKSKLHSIECIELYPQIDIDEYFMEVVDESKGTIDYTIIPHRTMELVDLLTKQYIYVKKNNENLIESDKDNEFNTDKHITKLVEENTNLFEQKSKMESELSTLKHKMEQQKTLLDIYQTFYRAKHDDVNGTLFKYRNLLINIRDMLKDQLDKINNAQNCDTVEMKADIYEINHYLNMYPIKHVYENIFNNIKEICDKQRHFDTTGPIQCLIKQLNEVGSDLQKISNLIKA